MNPITGIAAARAASGPAAAAPPRSEMNSRRFMSSMGGLSISAADRPVRSVFRTSNLPQSGRKVLGEVLNRPAQFHVQQPSEKLLARNQQRPDAPRVLPTRAIQ